MDECNWRDCEVDVHFSQKVFDSVMVSAKYASVREFLGMAHIMAVVGQMRVPLKKYTQLKTEIEQLVDNDQLSLTNRFVKYDKDIKAIAIEIKQVRIRAEKLYEFFETHKNKQVEWRRQLTELLK